MPVAIPAAIALAWAVAIAAEATGHADAIHHDRLAHAGLPLGVTVGVFLVSWQAMIAAMMLPASVPMMRLFAMVAAGQPRPARALAAFVAGYAVVWSTFGVGAFVFDLGLHRFVEHSRWLESRPRILPGVVLLVAGAFQFSGLKERCLDMCRNPGAYLLPRYRRGTAEAFRLGRGHGLFCVGCCWALMLLMFAVGVTSLVWMAALAGLMFYEKAGRHGALAGAATGGTLLAWGAAVLLAPGALPGLAVP